MGESRLLRVVWPVLAALFFGVGLAGFLVRGESETAPFLIVGSLFLAYSLLVRSRVRHVEADDSVLYVLDGRSEIAVPLSEIAGIPIKGFRFPRLAFIVFKSPTAAGKNVMFAPIDDRRSEVPESVRALRLRAGFSGDWRGAA